MLPGLRSWQRTHPDMEGTFEMYATPAVDENGNKIALDFPCYGDGTTPVGPESCGLTLWYSHDSEPKGPGLVFQRYASCDNKHSWFFTASATEMNAMDVEGVTLGHLEDDSKSINPFEKPKPRAQFVVQINPPRM